ncbi:hypothetical protein CPB83DRAFT_932672 [Crepidotus variabilis]|uniref:Uncharacterized protein n=1 Tax=Crepidotus variabilis TaxID=179855 RepID=A0A9P6BC28_9AGAR|nr:hypothetical protein CPB83DRAFT_932672 [Crepidotus variabilis]
MGQSHHHFLDSCLMQHPTLRKSNAPIFSDHNVQLFQRSAIRETPKQDSYTPTNDTTTCSSEVPNFAESEYPNLQYQRSHHRIAVSLLDKFNDPKPKAHHRSKFPDIEWYWRAYPEMGGWQIRRGCAPRIVSTELGRSGSGWVVDKKRGEGGYCVESGFQEIKKEGCWSLVLT